MAEAFGASREFLSMTTLLPGDAVADDATGAFHLQAHLRRVFGVDDLQDAAESLRRLHDEAQAQARQLRQATRRAVEDLSRLRTALAEAEAAEAAAQAARDDARRILEFAQGQLDRPASTRRSGPRRKWPGRSSPNWSRPRGARSAPPPAWAGSAAPST